MSETIIRNGIYQLTCNAETDLMKGVIDLSMVLLSNVRGYYNRIMDFHTSFPVIIEVYEDSMNVMSTNDNIDISYQVRVMNGCVDPICVNVEVAMNVTPIHGQCSSASDITLGELILMIDDKYNNYDIRSKSTVDLKIDLMILGDLMHQLGIGSNPIEGRTFSNQILSLYSDINRELTYRRNMDCIREQYEGFPIRKTRDMYRREGHFIPDEPYGSDSMSSSWLSSDDYGLGLQKWENAGRIAIHAIKLG